MRRFLSRWIVRAIVLAVLASIFLVQGAAGAFIGWAVFGYLLFRAFPAVRQDFLKLWRAGNRISTHNSHRNARF